jgi:hypothetical protein
MLTTVAALVILLGLMVSLSNYVRNASAVNLTRSQLRQLDALMAQYEKHYGSLPDVPPFIDPKKPDPTEEGLRQAALANNRVITALLRPEAAISPGDATSLRAEAYNEPVLNDAWGTPIVFMPAMNPLIGMAPQNRRFFFSAGRDHRFLTQEDNLYSYEEGTTTIQPSKREASSAGHPE